MFGGSTMWVRAARDDETIASWLQHMLDSRHSCVDVTNMGQNGYVNTQEALLLAEQLQRGDIPNVVIFYDGYNEVFAAEDDGTAGLTYDEATRFREFNLLNYSGSLFKQAAIRFVLDTGVGELAKGILIRLAPSSYVEDKQQTCSYRRARAKAARLASDAQLQESIVRLYVLNKIFIDALAARFGFRSLTYWQPWLLDKNKLTAYEMSQEERILPGERVIPRGLPAYRGDCYEGWNSWSEWKLPRHTRALFH